MASAPKLPGFRTLTPTNARRLLGERNLAGFKKVGRPQPLETYSKGKLTAAQAAELRRFAPKTEVAMFRDPSGKRFAGFRTAQTDGTLVFVLLPGNFVPVCAEFRHGCERVILTLPGGVIEPGDRPEATAKREFAEETGISLKKLIQLNAKGIPVDARNSTRKNFYFVGVLTNPLNYQSMLINPAERIGRFLVRLDHWFEFMERGIVDECAMAATLLALKQGRYSGPSI